MARKKNDTSPIVILIILLLIGAGLYFAWRHLPAQGVQPAAPDGVASTSVDASAASVMPPAPELTADEQAAAAASAQGFAYMPHATYVPAVWNGKTTGNGYEDHRNWSPVMCFPVEAAPAFANSQVYGPGGGGNGAPVPGGQSTPPNYAYPWKDTFCEWRTHATGYCTGGKGHQGQDIRPATPVADQHWAVAAEEVRFVFFDHVTLQVQGTKPPYRYYNYLHLKPSSLKITATGPTKTVQAGERLGQISTYLKAQKKPDASGCKPGYSWTAGWCYNRSTTVHLHFEVKMNTAETLSNGTLIAAQKQVSPYAALVLAYQRKLGNVDCRTLQ